MANVTNEVSHSTLQMVTPSVTRAHHEILIFCNAILFLNSVITLHLLEKEIALHFLFFPYITIHLLN